MSQVETRRNYSSNPSFEIDTNGWMAGGTGVLSKSSVWADTGTASALMTVTSTSSTSGDIRLSGSSPTVIPAGVVPGQTLYIEAKVNIPAAHTTADAGANSRQRRILIFISTDGTTYTQYFGPQCANAPGVYTLTHSVAVPANATGIIIAVGCAGSATDANFLTYIDSVYYGPTPGAFFYGSTSQRLADGGTYRYFWAGTPNASQSYETFEPDIPAPGTYAGMTNRDLEIRWLRKQTGFAGQATVADLRKMLYGESELAYWATRSGLLSGSLSDHKIAAMRVDIGVADSSLADVSRVYWAKNGL